jgi:GAF domain-containing protein
MPDLMALQDLCGLLDRGEIDRAEFLAQFTRRLAKDIGCSRAGVRILLAGEQGLLLRCVAMYDAVHGRVVRPPDLRADDPAPFIDALARDGSVVAPDCGRHPATRPFLAGYLRPQDVRSLLDVSFSVNGVLYGSFSCEQVGGMQDWTPQQLQLLRRMAGRVSLALVNAITAELDTGPGALWRPSSPNRLVTMPLPLDDDGQD